MANRGRGGPAGRGGGDGGSGGGGHGGGSFTPREPPQVFKCVSISNANGLIY